MTPSMKSLLGVAAALAMTATAAVGLAQEGPPPGGPRGGFGADGGRPGPEMREQMLRQRLALRPDQETAFKAFLDASGPPMGPGARAGRAQARAMTTPERLDQQLEQMRRRVDATKRFYAVLSPEQRQTFDSMPMAMGPEGRGGGGRGGRRGPGGGAPGFGAPPQP